MVGNPFSCTLRGLAGERRTGGPAVVAAAAAVLVAWLIWAAAVQVTVAAEGAGEVVPAEAPRVVAAPVDGVLAGRWLGLGARVEAGTLLATFEDGELRLRRRALAARRTQLAAQAVAAAAQAAARGEALRAAEAAAAAEIQARERSGDAAAVERKLAIAVGERDARLWAAGALSQAAAERSRAEAAARSQAGVAAAMAAAAAGARERAALADRRGEMQQSVAERARLAGELAAAAAAAAEVDGEIARRRVLAPVAGRLAAVTVAQAGAFLHRGAALATVVPEGRCEVVAELAAPAGGAVRIGQPAWVRLVAGRGERRGPFAARVAAVAPMARPGGGWEVRLVLTGGDAAGWEGVRPGVECEVAVEVERATPGRLLVRFLGWPG